MKLKPQDLSRFSTQPLPPVLLLHGDEELLIQESVALIRQAAKTQGFEERLVFNVDAKTDWQPIEDEAMSLGLFSQTKLIELHLAGTGFGKQGTDKLMAMLARADADLRWLIVCGKLDTRTQKTAWFTQIEALGASVQHWAIKASELGRWLGARLAQRGLKAQPDALNKLAWYVEGNLMAANQEVERLALLYAGQTLSLAQVDASVSETARFAVFSLTDTWLQSSAMATLRVLWQQKEEGVQPPVLVGLLAKEFSLIAQGAFVAKQGQNPQGFFKQMRVWDSKVMLLSRAVQKFNLAKWQAGILKLAQIDAVFKGQAQGDAWLLLEELFLEYEVGS